MLRFDRHGIKQFAKANRTDFCHSITSLIVLDVKEPGFVCGPGLDPAPLLSRGSGGCSSFMHAFSRMLVHFPLVPA